METKICKDCKESKSIDCFSSALNKMYPDLKKARCKPCHKKWSNSYNKVYSRIYYKRKHPKKEKVIKTEKYCKDCKVTMSIDKFYKNKSRCISCYRILENPKQKLRMRKRVLNAELKARIQKSNRDYQKRSKDVSSDVYMKKLLVDAVAIISGLRPSYKDITEDMVKAMRGKILITKQINHE